MGNPADKARKDKGPRFPRRAHGTQVNREREMAEEYDKPLPGDKNWDSAGTMGTANDEGRIPTDQWREKIEEEEKE